MGKNRKMRETGRIARAKEERERYEKEKWTGIKEQREAMGKE